MSKFKLEFDGLAEMAKRLEKMNLSVQETAEEALKQTHAHVTSKIENAMESSRYNFSRTGKTKGALQRDANIEWEGSTASVPVGFDIAGGGLPSIFLMHGTTVHGTPRVAPDKGLYNAVFGAKTRKEIAELQQNVFIKKIIEGGGP